jgi:hypothetical protein
MLMQGESAARRGVWLTALAAAMALMALSNLWKPVAQHLTPASSAGFVFFGTRLHGTANAIVGPLFGVLLAFYAYGVWRLRRWVVPLATAYAAYVVLNLTLFTLRTPSVERPPLLFMLAYAAIAIGVSAGGAAALILGRDRLR